MTVNNDSMVPNSNIDYFSKLPDPVLRLIDTIDTSMSLRDHANLSRTSKRWFAIVYPDDLIKVIRALSGLLYGIKANPAEEFASKASDFENLRRGLELRFNRLELDKRLVFNFSLTPIVPLVVGGPLNPLFISPPIEAGTQVLIGMKVKEVKRDKNVKWGQYGKIVGPMLGGPKVIGISVMEPKEKAKEEESTKKDIALVNRAVQTVNMRLEYEQRRKEKENPSIVYKVENGIILELIK